MRQEPTYYLQAGIPPSLHRRSQLGQDLVEFAMMLPLLLALTFGIVDIAHVVFSYNTIANAAREGARYGVIDPDIAHMRTAAEQLTTGLLCTPTITPSATAITVTVSVQCDAPLITGVFVEALGGSNTLTAQATMRLE